MTDDKELARKCRDSAFSMQVGTAERDGAVLEAIVLPDGLYTVSERSIHRMLLASMIDPAFDHPDTPHVHQRVASAGTNDEIVRRTLMQANRLFQKQYLDEGKCGQAMTAVYNAMQELLGAEDLLVKLRADIATAEQDLPKHRQQAMALPAVGEVDARGKSFVQRAEHTLQAAFRLAAVFFGDTRKPGFFEGVAANVREGFPDDQGFIMFAESLATFAKLVRGLRHSIEHRKENQQIDFLDYRFDAGEFHRPGVRVSHPDVPITAMPLDQFMEEIIANLVDVVESLIVFLAGSHVKDFGQMPIAIGQHPRFGEGNIRVKFTYMLPIGNPPEWHPLG